MWSGDYYYRSVRTPAGPRRQYVGTGLLAECAAADDDLQRQLRQLQAEQRRQECDHERSIDAQLDADYARLRTAAHAAIVAAGWYQHKRTWRRTINMLESETTMDTKQLTEVARRYNEAAARDEAAAQAVQSGRTDVRTTTPEAADIKALLERCNVATPKRADLEALRELVATSQGASLVALSGFQVGLRLVELYDSTPSAAAVVRGEMERLARDLGYAAAPPVERALIEHIVCCWVRLQLTELTLTRITQTEHTRNEGIYREKRLTEAQRRYLRAMNTLARLRSLAPASLQVNVAGVQQVNNYDRA